jgi:hypothetical protein
VSDAAFVGFRVVGDAATPLGVGLFATDARLSVHDVEIIGATRVAVDLSSGAQASLVGSDIHDNPGAGLSIRAGAAPRIAHNAFARNGLALPGSSVVVEAGAEPVFYRNVFQGMTSDALGLSADRARDLGLDNWFIAPPRPVPAAPERGHRR